MEAPAGANFMSQSREGKFHLVKSIRTSGEIFAGGKKQEEGGISPRGKMLFHGKKFGLEELLSAELCTVSTPSGNFPCS